MGSDFRWDGGIQVTEGGVLGDGAMPFESPGQISAIVKHTGRVQQRSECHEDSQAG